jgi:NADPH:quinone reductase
VRAIEVHTFGPPEVLGVSERPDPVPGPGQVVITTSVCDVLFVDTLIRSGRGKEFFPIRPPYVPGNGVGGVITAIGADVPSHWQGRRVVAHTGGAGGTGGYTSHALADLDSSIPVPDQVDLAEATAVLHDGTTALRILETFPVDPGDQVLVLGATGGMGILLLQLLADRGARVIGAAGGTTKQEVIKNQGAVASVDYGRPEWVTEIREMTGGNGLSLVLDGVGGELGSAAFSLVAEGGAFSAHGTPSGAFAPIDRDEARRRGITVRTIIDLQYGPDDRSRLMQDALVQLQRGRITPLIGQTFRLADAGDAHRTIEDRRAMAKTLLRVPSS